MIVFKEISHLVRKINFPISRFVVEGSSMFPALKSGQSVITLSWFVRPQLNDIVVASINRRMVIKRIKKISKDKVFLIGDNGEKSTDSRDFGEVLIKDLKGKVILVL